MGFFSELHAQIYYEPRWESDYYREAREEWNKELREIEDRIAQADCEARPIDFNEKTMLVKAKCQRAAQRLSEERKRAAADEVLRHNQRRIRKRLERLLTDFPREEVLQELKRMELC
jgi:hypothetical protein